MKLKFIDELLSETKEGDNCDITGRVSSVRCHGNITFLDLTDHTGKIQLVLETSKHALPSEDMSGIKVGSYIAIKGKYFNRDKPEINIDSLNVLAPATITLSPNPWKIDGTDPTYGSQVFNFPDFYLPNPKRAAVLRIKTNFVQALHTYFQSNRFTLVEPPILTDKTLSVYTTKSKK